MLRNCDVVVGASRNSKLTKAQSSRVIVDDNVDSASLAKGGFYTISSDLIRVLDCLAHAWLGQTPNNNKK